MSDKNQERKEHFENNTIHDLVVAGHLLKENLMRLVEAGLESGSDMTEETAAIHKWYQALTINGFISSGLELKDIPKQGTFLLKGSERVIQCKVELNCTPRLKGIVTGVCENCGFVRKSCHCRGFHSNQT